MLTLSALFALLLGWMLLHAVRTATEWDALHIGYVTVLAGLVLLFAWFPFDHWRFERLLTEKAIALSGNPAADVHCSSISSSVFDHPLLSGRAHTDSGDIHIQYPTCPQLKAYVDDPERAGLEEIVAMHVFVHEAMHVRGESNEQRTDCMAIQRSYRAARLLGASERAAEAHGLAYYQGPYRAHHYRSDECVPGGALDERLSDSSWRNLPDSADRVACASVAAGASGMLRGVLNLSNIECD
jgi:hypothetical protein